MFLFALSLLILFELIKFGSRKPQNTHRCTKTLIDLLVRFVYPRNIFILFAKNTTFSTTLHSARALKIQ